jgi:Fe2+ or Zn2+ uptake regulation protein
MEHLKNMTASHIIILNLVNKASTSLFSHDLIEKLLVAIPEISENFAYRQIQKLDTLGLLKITRYKKKGPINLVYSTPTGKECYRELFQYLSENSS